MMYGHEREVKKKMNVYFKPEKKQHSATTPLAFILPSLKAFGKASYKGVTLRNACNAQKREDTSYFMQLIIFFLVSCLAGVSKEGIAHFTSFRRGGQNTFLGWATNDRALCLGWSCNYPWNGNDPC